jgi:DNA-binding transcriptional ArsR family regulator
VDGVGEEREESIEALFHPLRIRIILLLNEEGELYPNQIAESLDKDRGLVAYHLNVLERAGLVKSEYKMVSPGKFAKFYSVDREKVKEAIMKRKEFYREFVKELIE